MVASSDSRRHAASAASNLFCVRAVEELEVANRLTTHRLPAAPFSACVSRATAAPSFASTAALIAAMRDGQSSDEPLNDFGEQRRVSAQPLECGLPLESGRHGPWRGWRPPARPPRRAGGAQAACQVAVQSLRRRRSRSPAMAWAVIAMIRMCPPVACSRRRISAVASNPSIFGICTSIGPNGTARLRARPPPRRRRRPP